MTEPLRGVQPRLRVESAGGDDLDIGHTGNKKRRCAGLVDHVVPIESVAYEGTFNWWIDREDGSYEQCETPRDAT